LVFVQPIFIHLRLRLSIVQNGIACFSTFFLSFYIAGTSTWQKLYIYSKYLTAKISKGRYVDK